MSNAARMLAIRIALTVTALEFFGPLVRDLDASHLLNESWVGHARIHLMWLLGFMGLSGLANLYLIWLRKPRDVRDLRLSAAWQSCNLGGFWIACLTSDAYQGAITVPGIHVHVFGIDENVFVFGILSLVMLGVWVGLSSAPREAHELA
jgi:hypothetical protein